MMAGRLLDIKQVQEILGLSERTIFRFISSGELKGFKVGRQWRFEESDITDFIARRRQESERVRRDAQQDGDGGIAA